MRNFAYLSFTLLAACGTSKPSGGDDLAGLAGSGKADFSSRLKLFGNLRDGVNLDIAYHNPPRFSGVTFKGTVGDQVSVGIDSADGSSVAWVTDSDFNELVRSTDQDPGVNHFGVTLGETGVHYLILRDQQLGDATFTVGIDGATEPKGQLGDSCGGFVADPVQCDVGLVCQYNNVPDIPGTCVQAKAGLGESCGGFVAHPVQCQDGLVCVSNGIPDLPGTCQQPM